MGPHYGTGHSSVTVAEVQVDLGAHGVAVESSAETTLYQGDTTLKILGSGFNETKEFNTLKWGNSLRGKGINYTIVDASADKLGLELLVDFVNRGVGVPVGLVAQVKLDAVVGELLVWVWRGLVCQHETWWSLILQMQNSNTREQLLNAH